MRGDRCPPAPPDSVIAALHTQTLSVGTAYTRVHWATRPALGFSITRGANRFDPLGTPWQGTRVLYAASRLEVALSETVLRWRQVIGPHLVDTQVELAPRSVADFTPRRDLVLIDATALGLVPIQHALHETLAQPAYRSIQPRPQVDEIFNCSEEDYPTTHAWGAWLRTQRPDADGILWVSRQFNTGVCMVLFADRCEHDLEQVGASRPMMQPGSAEQRAVDAMLNKLRWGRT